MESNFIKERTVIRREIIENNLASEKKTPESKSKQQDIPLENPPEHVVAFEEVVNDKLKFELAQVSQQANKVCEIIAEYLKIKSALKIFKTNPRDIEVQTNLGCNFYAQCHIEDARRIYLCVGKDYYLHMDLDEALGMIDFLESNWSKQLDLLQERASKIKAYIKVALEALGRLYEVDREKLMEED